MLFTKLGDDFGSRGGIIAKGPHGNGFFIVGDELFRKPMGIRGKTLFRNDAGNLPVPRGRVLPFRELSHTGIIRGRLLHRVYPLYLVKVPQAHALQVGKRQSSQGPGDSPECIGALITISVGIRHCARAHAVQND